MSSKGKYIRFDDLQLAELGNGFFGKDPQTKQCLSLLLFYI
jgi:hypothetical protein